MSGAKSTGRRWRTGVLCALGTLAAVQASDAAIYTRNSVSSDREVREGGTAPASVTATIARVGYNPDATNQGRRYVALFFLPTLAPGETITNVDLDVRLNTLAPGGDGNFNVDVVGLGTRPQGSPPSSTSSGTDYSAASTLLVDNIIPDNPATVPGNYFASSSTSGNGALTTYVQGIYAAGGPTFDPDAANLFLVLRFDQDAPNPGVTTGGTGVGYNIVTGDAATPADHPRLQITTVVPEPASIGLPAAGAGFALRCRRRHVQL